MEQDSKGVITEGKGSGQAAGVGSTARGICFMRLQDNENRMLTRSE